MRNSTSVKLVHARIRLALLAALVKMHRKGRPIVSILRARKAAREAIVGLLAGSRLIASHDPIEDTDKLLEFVFNGKPVGGLQDRITDDERDLLAAQDWRLF